MVVDIFAEKSILKLARSSQQVMCSIGQQFLEKKAVGMIFLLRDWGLKGMIQLGEGSQTCIPRNHLGG